MMNLVQLEERGEIHLICRLSCGNERVSGLAFTRYQPQMITRPPQGL